MNIKVKLHEYGYNILQIETKASCNMACRFCPYPLREDKRSILPKDAVHRLIDTVDPADGNFSYVCFSQFNEPLMDKRIFDFIRYAKSKNVPTMLTTNALLLDKAEVVNKLLDAAPEIIKISLQTLDKKTFNEVRGVQFDINKYYTIIYSFLSVAQETFSRISVDVGCNFLNRGQYLFRSMLGLSTGDPSIPLSLKSIEDDIISFLIGLTKYNPSFDINISELLTFLRSTSADYISEEGFSLAGNIRLRIKPFLYGRRIKDFQPAKHSFKCSNRILSVLADGSLVPCCLLYNSTLSLGNVKEKSLSEILYQNREFLRNLQSKNTLTHEICRKCMGEPSKRGVWIRKLLSMTALDNSSRKLGNALRSIE